MPLAMRRVAYALILCLSLSLPAQAQPDQLRMLFLKAIEAFERKDFKQSIYFFEEAIKVNPRFGPAYNYLSLAYKNNGAEDSIVETILKTGVQMAPEYAPLYDNLGKIAYSRSDFDAAEQFATKAVELDPELESAHLSLAWIYLVGKSDPEAAIPHFEKGTVSTNSTYAYFGLGVAYAMSGRKIEVLDMITKLRAAGQNDFARELESMVRDNTYLPPVARRKPKTEDNKAVLIEDHAYDVGEQVPVRLKHSGPQLSDDASLGHPESEPTSAAERIRQLRQRTAIPSGVAVDPGSSSGGLGMPKGPGY